MPTYDQMWHVLPRRPTLTANDVHVLLVPLNRFTGTLIGFEQLLSPDERARSNRLHFERDRQRFIAVHGILRTLLAAYLDTAPRDLRFELSSFGKPALLREKDAPHLDFNLSHSGDLALIAVSLGRALGIDIEHKRPLADADAIAEAHFSAAERTALRALSSGNARTDAFYACWTRKEAYIKAIGKGLSMPLDQFDVTLAADEPVLLLRVQDAPEELVRWALYSLDPAQGYAGALVVEGASHHICCWTLPDLLGCMF